MAYQCIHQQIKRKKLVDAGIFHGSDDDSEDE